MRKMQGKGRAKRWTRRKASKRRQPKKPLSSRQISAMRKQAGAVYDAINRGDSFIKQWADAYAAGGPQNLSPKASEALDKMFQAGEEAFRRAPPTSHFND